MFGLIRKKKVALAVAEIYNQREDDYRNHHDDFEQVCSAQSALNFLLTKLNIRSAHHCEPNGTGKLTYTIWKEREEAEDAMWESKMNEFSSIYSTILNLRKH